MPRRHLFWRVGSLLGMGAAALAMAATSPASEALADGTFTTTLTVNAVGESALLPGGQAPNAVPGQNAITISWGPSTFHSGKEVAGYTVNRQTVGDPAVVQVCSVTAPMRVCRDTPPANQQVMYIVVPTASSWKGQASAPSAPVMLADPPASPTPLSTTTPSPSPSPSASASSTVTPSPIATASPSASTSASATPTPTPAPSPS